MLSGKAGAIQIVDAYSPHIVQTVSEIRRSKDTAPIAAASTALARVVVLGPERCEAPLLASRTTDIVL